MSQAFFIVFITLLAGSCLSVQAGINYQLQSHWAGSPVLAACVSFTIGALALMACTLLSRTPIPALPDKIIWWHWIGGFLGAVTVTVTVYAAPKIGATAMMALILAGQLGSGLILDHFGLVGYAQKSVTLPRLIGIFLVGGGVVLIRRF